MRAEEKEDKGEHVGKPDLDAAAHKGPRYTSESFSPTPMIRPPMMAPGTEVRPPRITTGSARSASVVSENCTPSLEPQMIPATSAVMPATNHTITQMR